MNFRIRWVLCAAITAACCVGCESMNDDADERDRDRIGRRDRERLRDRDLDRPDPVIGRDRDLDRRDREVDRRDRGRRGLNEIPADAIAVEGGEGAGLRYEPNRDGTIYVYDVDDDRVIYVGRLQERERFVLDPSGNRATVDGHPVFRSDLNRSHRYRLYFDRAGR